MQTWGWIRASATLLSLVLITSCAYDPERVDDAYTVAYEIDAVRTMEEQGPMFNRGLRTGYLGYGDSQWDENDFSEYYHFAFKAVDSAKGERVLPDRVEERSVPMVDAEALAAARARLMGALDQTARKKAALRAADAQVAFDCWLERVDDGDSPERIEECRGRFEQAMAEIERSLVSDVDNVYLVFFAWDQADISPVARTVLEQVLADYRRGLPTRLVLAGHADRSGSESYNLALSERRARAVAGALEQMGVPGDALVLEWFGESRPRVPTEDGVRQPQNRRVEIVFG
ncbi:MAG: OmpA family protein [Geminicoccaceae bacterium]|nr:OmpA family protein [Geminicoccaceae bacterium]